MGGMVAKCLMQSGFEHQLQALCGIFGHDTNFYSYSSLSMSTGILHVLWGCQWGIAIVSKQLKKCYLVSKQQKNRLDS